MFSAWRCAFHATGPACEKARSPNLVRSRTITEPTDYYWSVIY